MQIQRALFILISVIGISHQLPVTDEENLPMENKHNKMATSQSTDFIGLQGLDDDETIGIFIDAIKNPRINLVSSISDEPKTASSSSSSNIAKKKSFISHVKNYWEAYKIWTGFAAIRKGSEELLDRFKPERPGRPSPRELSRSSFRLRNYVFSLLDGLTECMNHFESNQRRYDVLLDDHVKKETMTKARNLLDSAQYLLKALEKTARCLSSSDGGSIETMLELEVIPRYQKFVFRLEEWKELLEIYRVL